LRGAAGLPADSSPLLTPQPPSWCLQEYANGKNIKIIGDMPIYVGGHSADVWANQRLFELSPTGFPANVSGVPPDAFSATGG
jgi:4-alpha-glucanotransferase